MNSEIASRSRRSFRLAGAGFLLAITLLVPGKKALAGLAADLHVSGLDFPVFATAPPGDPRLFIVERVGRIRVFSQGTLLPTPFLDISSQVSDGGERGLFGLAFSPDYGVDGFFYVYYTNLDGNSVVSRFEVSAGNPDAADPASELLLMPPIVQPAANHNGGTIAFSPADGFLYFAPGDGGGPNDPDERSQDPAQLLGKMLRIDVTGVLPVEIWASGLRNPYRFSFDRDTGDLWIADVGQRQREEIDLEPAGDPGGRNYGWDVMEGTLCNTVDPAPAPPCNDPSLTLPLYEYSHADGNCSITGGFLYRGAIAELRGHYVFGDFCSSRIWTLDPAIALATDRSAELGAAAAAAFQLVGFGEDAAGELYVIHSGGDVFRIRSDAACSDGLDNDGDGLTDHPADPGCAEVDDTEETDLALPCDDAIDNDADGRIDFDPVTFANPGDQNTLPPGSGDPGCKSPTWFSEEPRCQDGLDNDGDGMIDYDAGLSRNGIADPGGPDPTCVNPEQNRESPCGLGAELALLLPPLMRLWRRRRS
jgi:glucose/arabinose dehydrogenase